MEICKPHWDALRTAIEDRGLSHLVAKDAAANAKNLQAQMSGTDDDSNYDPLMAAYWAITSNSLQVWGLDSMQPDFGCPLCALDQHSAECTDEKCPKDTGTTWIGYAADGQLSIATEKGLVGKPN